MVISCQDLHFEPALSRERLALMCAAMGDTLVGRVVALGLYMLGATRSSIGRIVGLPQESVKTLMKTLQRDGLSALEDRRRSHSMFLPQAQRPPVDFAVRQNDAVVTVDFGDKRLMELSRSNTLQVRTVVLSLYEAGLLNAESVACVLDLTQEHVRKLAQRLREGDVMGLFDHRKGQQHDYRIDKEVKTELIQQYAAHAITGRSVASAVVTEELNAREGWNISARSLRHHISKLGLQRIALTLPALVEQLKKTPDNRSERGAQHRRKRARRQ